MIPLETLVSVAAAVIIFFLMLGAVNDMSAGDGRGTLLTAHAVYTSGNLQLDNYPNLANPKNYKFEIVNDHVYYALALGTPLLCVPVIAVVDLMGLDILDLSVESHVQRILAALIVSLIFLVLWHIFRLALSVTISLVLSLAFVLGTTWSSTAGTGLGNQGVEVLLLLLAMYLVLRQDYRAVPVPGLRLGLILGLAYVVRPTALIAIGMAGLYVLFCSRKSLLTFVLGLLLCFLGLVALSYSEFGYALPSYYRAILQEETWQHSLVFRGILFSPGRGLFIFSPFLVIPIAWVLTRYQCLTRKGIAILSVVWFFAQVIAMARHMHWWGGTCFGPRLLSDAVVAIVPITLIATEDFLRIQSRGFKIAWRLSFFLLALVSIFIHLFQGLYNPYTLEWNRRPSIETNVVAAVFDWQYPQFFASNEILNQRELKYIWPKLPPADLNTMLSPTSKQLIFLNWGKPRKDKNSGWAVAPRSTRPRIIFRSSTDIEPLSELQLTFSYDGDGQLDVVLDGQIVGQIQAGGTELQNHTYSLETRLLQETLREQTRHIVSFLPVDYLRSDPQALPTTFKLYTFTIRYNGAGAFTDEIESR